MTSNLLSPKIPACAAAVLARREWFADPGVVRRARLSPPNWLARLLSSRRFAGQEIAAITLGKTIYFRMPDQYNPHTPAGLAILAHELKHVEQFEREGWGGFYAKYVRGYLAHGYGEPIPFEAEAYEFQRQVAVHLAREFEANPAYPCCREMADPHTPNESFTRLTPEIFRFVSAPK